MNPGVRTAVKEAERLYSLDALRGVAALSVVLWHWQHFFFLSGPTLRVGGHFDRRAEPLYFMLRPFYDHGDLAVDLFFILSGFVFFWLYENEIAEHRISAFKFSCLRFARLYPLFLATLVIVGVMQEIYRSNSGVYFIYQKNDIIHFSENAFLFNKGTSFNGPTWSITAEILAYVMFYTVVRTGVTVRWWWTLFLMIGVGLMLMPVDSGFSRAVAGFFAGGAVNRLFRWLTAAGTSKNVSKALMGLTIFGWVVVVYFTFVPNALAFNTKNVVISNVYFQFFLFPSTVLFAAVHERLLGGRYGLFAWLGKISYSSYLLHFPLQLAIAILVEINVLSATGMYSWMALVAFYAVLIPVSWLTYLWFEVPAQRIIRVALRKHGLGRAPVGQPAD